MAILHPEYEGLAVAAAVGVNTETRFFGANQVEKAFQRIMEAADVQVENVLASERVQYAGEQAVLHS